MSSVWNTQQLYLNSNVVSSFTLPLECGSAALASETGHAQFCLQERQIAFTPHPLSDDELTGSTDIPLQVGNAA